MEPLVKTGVVEGGAGTGRLAGVQHGQRGPGETEGRARAESRRRCQVCLPAALSPLHCHFQEFPLNPKALSLGELYGEYDLNTNEWTDGILSSVMRVACAGIQGT